MDDLISRQAAIDALADYIHDLSKIIGRTGELSAHKCEDVARHVLKKLPSAQSEIIKCKDCIHRYKKINIPMCDFVDFCPTDSSYCSLGEK